jgi:hypothetical protein
LISIKQKIKIQKEKNETQTAIGKLKCCTCSRSCGLDWTWRIIILHHNVKKSLVIVKIHNSLSSMNDLFTHLFVCIVLLYFCISVDNSLYRIFTAMKRMGPEVSWKCHWGSNRNFHTWRVVISETKSDCCISWKKTIRDFIK